MASPAADVALLLQNALVGTIGTNIYIGKLPDQNDAPHKAIGVFDTGSAYTNPKWQRDEFLVQILVRGPQQNYQEGYDFAEAAKGAVLGVQPQTLNGNYYAGFLLNGGINGLGTDQRDRHIFSLNFRVIAENRPGGVRDPF
jgi:hypothetical protein